MVLPKIHGCDGLGGSTKAKCSLSPAPGPGAPQLTSAINWLGSMGSEAFATTNDDSSTNRTTTSNSTSTPHVMYPRSRLAPQSPHPKYSGPVLPLLCQPQSRLRLRHQTLSLMTLQRTPHTLTAVMIAAAELRHLGVNANQLEACVLLYFRVSNRSTSKPLPTFT